MTTEEVRKKLKKDTKKVLKDTKDLDEKLQALLDKRRRNEFATE